MIGSSWIEGGAMSLDQAEPRGGAPAIVAPVVAASEHRFGTGPRDAQALVPIRPVDCLLMAELPAGQIALAAGDPREGAAIMILANPVDRKSARESHI